MLDRYQLEAFAAVLEYQNFDRAALALGLTKGAVSQRIKSLEESLCTVLLLRGKPSIPTPVGEVVLRHVKALRLLEQDVYLAASAGPVINNQVSISIAVDANSLATWFRSLTSVLVEELPVALEIIVENLSETCSLLHRGDVAGCVATNGTAAPGFDAVYLGEMEYRCVSTPAFAASYFPNGLHLEAALAAPVILLNRKDSLHDEFIKMLFGIATGKYIRHYFSSPATLLDAILAGRGYGIIAAEQANHWLSQRALVDLVPSNPLIVPLYWHHWRSASGVARRVREAITRAARISLQVADRVDKADSNAAYLTCNPSLQ